MMTTTIEVTDNLVIDLTTSAGPGELLLTIRAVAPGSEDKQQLILTIEEARDLVDALPGAIVHLAELEAEQQERRD